MNGMSWLNLLLTNAALAGGLALAVAALTRRFRHPALVRLAWLVVLLRLLVPGGIPLRLRVPAGMRLATATGAAVEVGVVAGTARLRAAASAANPWLVGWGAGAAVLAVVWLGQGVRLVRAVRRGRRDADPAIGAVLKSRAAALGVRPPRLVVVAGARIPPAIVAQPGGAVLLLPAHLVAALNPAEIDALIAHELTHLVRRDHWVRWLEVLALVLYWWYPVAWWVVRRGRRAEEQACDAKVRHAFPQLARPLARCLVQVARLTPPTVPLPASGFADVGQLERRIDMLVSNAVVRPRSIKELVAVICLAVAVGMTPVLRAGEPPWPAAAEEKVSLSLTSASLGEVVATLGKTSGVPIEVDARLLQRTVKLTVEDLPLHEVLARLAAATEAQLGWRGGAAVLTPKPGSTAPAPLPGQAAARQQPLRPGQDVGVEIPRKIHDVPPVYPTQARAARVQGVVVLEVTIDEQGRAADVRVLREASHGLTEAAVDAVCQWRWEPTIHEGRAVPVIITTTVKFWLESADTPAPSPEHG